MHHRTLDDPSAIRRGIAFAQPRSNARAAGFPPSRYAGAAILGLSAALGDVDPSRERERHDSTSSPLFRTSELREVATGAAHVSFAMAREEVA